MAVATLEQSSSVHSLKDYPQGAKGDRNALVGMQRVLWRKVNDPKTPAHIAAQCARAWRDLQDMKRIMDGKPLPGQLRPDLQQVKERKRKGPSLLPLPEVPAPIVEKTSKESLS